MQVEHILTHLRNKDTSTKDFRIYADRLMRILLEQALSTSVKKTVFRESPLGLYNSNEIVYQDEDYCLVSILRSGNAFLQESFKVIPGILVGSVLIQRDEKTAEPKLFYEKLPLGIEKKQIILVDPMLATGGSARTAIEVLKSHGVQESNILFVNLVACENGLKHIFDHFPQIRIITAQVDPLLIAHNKYLAPGIGDFGDRYYGTVQ